jgi:hypothetical protein
VSNTHLVKCQQPECWDGNNPKRKQEKLTRIKIKKCTRYNCLQALRISRKMGKAWQAKFAQPKSSDTGEAGVLANLGFI